MLNYPVQVGESENEFSDVNISGATPAFNPFPGLRPFAIDECHLFFGREGQVDEILMKLSDHRSVTVMGYSGSGKSSLMNCGLIPVLYGGFMTQTSPFWQVITVRPGTTPISNLTTAVVDHLLKSGRIDESDVPIQKAIISSVLRSGPEGLIEIAKYLQTQEGENIFFLVDQFEELFRYKESDDPDVENDASMYVNLVLNASHQKSVPIYTAINMRADFIGDCAVFPGLTKMINTSNYLVPQMTREQKRIAIEGPVAVGGGKISKRLVKRLMADVGDDQDQLPIMQHALMRTWEYWVENRDEGEPMDIRHYNAIGKIGQALSLHANEAFEELSTKEREIAEVLFKSVTEKNLENQGSRRPIRVKVLAELTSSNENEVVRVVDHFRKPGRSFLMPGSHVPLESDTLVELSHESMMRIWTRLSAWVEEEFESAQTYKRISEAAAMYQVGKTGLWRPPDLQLALNWQKKQRPTRSWAQRYDIAFERAIVFLDTSRITYEAELQSEEMLQQRRLRRARVTAVVFGVFALIAVLFFVYALIQRQEAVTNLAESIVAQTQAEEARNEAEDQRAFAENERLRAEDALDSVQVLSGRLSSALIETREALTYAEEQFREAERQRNIALAATDTANAQRVIALTNLQLAERARNEAQRLLYLSVAQSLEAKSFTMDEPILAGLTAMQGYLFHTGYQGKLHDPYVFNGLYSALTKLTGPTYNAIKMPGELRNRMDAVVLSKTNTTFYTTGNDGRIFKGDIMGQAAPVRLGANAFPNNVLALSKDERYLVNGSDSSFLQIYDLANPDALPEVIRGHTSSVTDIKFLPDDSGFISTSSDKTLRLTNHKTRQSRQILSLPYNLTSIDISRDGNSLVGVSATGKIVLVNLSTNTVSQLVDEGASNRILSVAFHPTKPLIAYGVEVLNGNNTERGVVKLFSLSTMSETKVLTGHTAGISAVEFSPDGTLLASAGLDHKLQMWEVDNEEDLPIVMTNNTGNIWDLSFSSGSNYLIASCNLGEIRVWPTDTRLLAEKICPELDRNMTLEEWDIYVANDIPYDATCKSLLINNF